MIKRITVKRYTAILLTILLSLGSCIQGFCTQNNSADERCRTTYEIFVYSFCDSDGDGTGDLNGVRSKLDYIQELGFDQIWLMPVCPSPTYHKYDVTDYMAIDPAYGTMEDFEALIAECHGRGIRIITDLVLNHTSSQHPWFLEAADYLRQLPEGAVADVSACPKLDYYHFTQSPESGFAQIPDTSWYYEARFWEGMPDLNLDSEAVRDEIRNILSFWIGKGVDGFRLDAVTYYYTGSDEKNIEFLRWLKETAVSIASAADSSEEPAEDGNAENPPYIVCEAWIDQSLYAQYYASGVDSMFDFAYAGAEGLLAKTVKGKFGADRFVESLAAEQELYASFSDSYVNAPFYTNHDMDRSAGYYAYDNGSRTKFALGLNLLISGNAFLYYGDELGMKGSGKDENKRVPMYWVDESSVDSEDPENPENSMDSDDPAADEDAGIAACMCSGPDGMDSVKQKFPSEAEQEKDPLSILNYAKQAIALRNKYDVIRDGRVIPVPELESEDVGVYLKVSESPDGKNNPGASEESVEVIFNTSEEPQTVDLSASGNEFRTLADTLCVSEDPVTLESDILSLPPFGVAVLAEAE